MEKLSIPRAEGGEFTESSGMEHVDVASLLFGDWVIESIRSYAGYNVH